MFALPSPAIHHMAEKAAMIRLRAFLSRLLRTNGATLLVALFDREIEVAIIDWRYAFAFVGFGRRFGYGVTHHRSDEITIYRMFTAEADILLALPIN